MKSFGDYVAMREVATFKGEKMKVRGDDALDPRSEASIKAMREAIRELMDSRPEVLVAFLNLHRADDDIKRILVNNNLDSFLVPKGKCPPDYKDSGLGDEEGEAQMIHPHSADGFNM